MVRKTLSFLLITIAFTLPLGGCSLVFPIGKAGIGKTGAIPCGSKRPSQLIRPVSHTSTRSLRMAVADDDGKQSEFIVREKLDNYASTLPDSLRVELLNLAGNLPQDVNRDEYTASLPPTFTQFRVNKEKKAVLSLDGGGVRGLITAYVLQVLEDELRNQTGIPDLLIGEAFDIVAGTSTGSILATYLTAYCGLAENKTVTNGEESVVLDGTVRNATKMYEVFAKEIFKKGKPEKGTNVWGLLKKIGYFAWNGVWRPMHDDEGLNHVLDQAFGHLTLEWLANHTYYKKDKDGTDRKAHVASLFVPAYDLTYHRPVAFMANRQLKTARFLGIDPFSEPYKGGGFSVLSVGENKTAEYYNALNRAHEDFVRIKSANKTDVPFNLNNLGEAQLPASNPCMKDFVRYRKSHDRNLNVKLSQICRCSAAAPVFLAPGRIENFFGEGLHLDCCDGGVVANAPALTAFNAMYFQACANYRNLAENTEGSISKDPTFRAPFNLLLDSISSNFPNHMVLSIGCGQTAKELLPKEAPRGLGSLLPDLPQKVWSFLTGSAPPETPIGLWDYLVGSGNLIDVLMSSNSQLSHANMDALFASNNSWENYLRIQLSVNEPVREDGALGHINDPAMLEALSNMDDSSAGALEAYERAGEYLAEVYRPLIKKFVERMLKEEGTDYWEYRRLQAIVDEALTEKDPWKNPRLKDFLKEKGYYTNE